MKTVPPHAHPFVLARYRKNLRNLWHLGVKRRIEAGDLQQSRMTSLDGLDQLDLHRQVFGSKGADAAQLGQQFGRHSLRFVVSRTAMDDSMSNGGKFSAT